MHVYGSVVPVSERNLSKFQHLGYGVLLMEGAERISINEHHSEKIAVISGVGTRKYYRKLGYHLEGPYMVKSLKPSEYKSALDCADQNSAVSTPVRLQGNVKFETHEEYINKHLDLMGVNRFDLESFLN